jgi:hypothetical protein
MTKQDKVAKVMHEWKNGRLFSNGKKVTDYDQAIAIALSEAGLSKYAEGGGIGFIPMDLHEELTHIAKFGGVKSEKDVIGILNAIVDSGLTDNDLETKPTRTGTQYELVLDKKTEEVWVKVKGNYKGDLKGNQYFSSLYEIIKRNNSNDAKLIERYKPFRKLSKGEELMEEGGMYSKGGNVIERRYVNKDEDYETRYAKDKPSRMGYKDERMFAEGGGVEEWNGRIFNKYFTKEKAESIIDTLEKEDEIEGFDIGFMGEQGYTITVINAYTDRETALNPYNLEMGTNSKGRFFIIPLKPMEDMPKQVSNKFAKGGGVGSLLEQRKELLEELINSDIIDEEHGYYDDVKGAIKSNDSEQMREIIDELLSSGLIYKDDWDYKLARKLSKENNKFAVGGEIGNTVSFKGDYGTPRSGVVKEKRGSSYIVSTDDGDRLVDSYEVISFSETPIAKKKRFGFFEGGGEIQSKIDKLQAVVNSKMLPEGVKEKARKQIAELEKELHESKETKAEEKDKYVVWEYETYKIISKHPTLAGAEKYAKELVSKNKSKLYSFGSIEKYERFKAEDKAKENKMTGESEGERNVGMDKPEDYVEAKVKNLEASLKDKTISEAQRKRDEKELALFKKATATTRKPTTRKAPIKKAVVKKAVAKKEVKGDLPKSKFEKGDKVGVSGHNEVYEIKDKSYRNNIEGELTWVYYLPEYSSVLVSEKNLKVVPKPKADHKKLVAKLKAKKGQGNNDRGDLINYKDGSTERRKRSESSDKKRTALPLGKRVSADGNVYWENRLNRGDLSKKDKFEKGGEVDKNSSSWGLNLNW